MGYYVRVFSHHTACVPAGRLRTAVEDVGATATETGDDTNWSSLLIEADGEAVLQISRELRGKHPLVDDELKEFTDALNDARPTSGAEWVRAFLVGTQTIYAVQFLDGAGDNGEAVGALIETLRAESHGVVQADAQGFSNQNGDLVVSQMDPRARGTWTVALRIDDAWRSFELDLRDRERFDTFLEGRLPAD